MRRRWMAGLKFEQAAHHIVLEDCIAAVHEAATVRRDRLEAHIEAALSDWSLTFRVGTRPASAARDGSGRGGDGDRRTR